MTKNSFVYTNLASEDQEFLIDLGKMLGYPIYFSLDRRHKNPPQKIFYDLENASIYEPNNHIRKLVCMEPKLKDFPPSITKLEFLKHIEISKATEMRTLPANLEKIPHLHELHLASLSKFIDLSDRIGVMTNLEKILIIDTPLKEIPSVIEHLHNLIHLEIASCQLNSIPESIGNLPKLETLCLRNNKLTEIPLSVANLKYLRELDLVSNPIQFFPYQVAELKYVDLMMETGKLIPEDKERVKIMEDPFNGFRYSSHIPAIKEVWEEKKRKMQLELKE